MSEQTFPTEIISLPSKGKYYDTSNPLSSGEVELKYMTAKEEDILTSPNLIKRGIVIDKLLESLIVDKNIKLNTMLLGDKTAIMIAARVLGYGKNYKYEYDCPACGEHNSDCVVDLTTLSEVDVKENVDFTFELPISKRKIKFKFLTHGDDLEIQKTLDSYKKISKGSWVTSEITTRLKYIITEIDGSTNKSDISKFVDTEFLAQDSLAFREYLQTIIPDVDMSSEFECSLCGWKEDITVPLTVQFFWPSTAR